MAHDRDEALGERAQHLLRILIESYIRDGQPVGSRALSRESGLQLSSATVRNVMADLEELGFVASPHTSAGRVPTDKGYRFFVDTLLQQRPLDEAAGAEIRRQFEVGRDNSTDLIATVSQLLSSATQLAGVVTLPRTRQASITQMEFVALSENRVLVVLVFNDREVQNRIIQLERHYSRDELKRASNFLNEQFRGRSLREVRQEILRQLSEAHAHMNKIMLEAIAVAQQVFESGAEQFSGHLDDGDDPFVGHARGPDDPEHADHRVAVGVRRGDDAAIIEDLVAGFMADEDLYPFGLQALVEQVQKVALFVERFEQPPQLLHPGELGHAHEVGLALDDVLEPPFRAALEHLLGQGDRLQHDLVHVRVCLGELAQDLLAHLAQRAPAELLIQRV